MWENHILFLMFSNKVSVFALIDQAISVICTDLITLLCFVTCPFASLQEFVLLKILEDATDYIMSIAWSDKLLAAAGEDKQIRIYKSDQDLGRPPTLIHA